MRTSSAAYKLIEKEEVGSKARYVKNYQRPVWPKYASGPTVGIGYDLGQTDAKTIRADWSGLVDDDMLEAMVGCSGFTSEAGRRKTAEVKNRILIPWDLALKVHKEKVIPRWEARLLKAMPNARKLHGHSFGALLSISFNRGIGVWTLKQSKSDAKDRFREGRAIRALISQGRFDEVPTQIRSMKRLWSGPPLPARRDKEAALFEQGLKKMGREPEPIEVDPVDEDDDVQEAALTRREVRSMQEQLKAMGYHEVGEVDGHVGSRTVAAIAAFMKDRNIKGKPTASREILMEVDAADEQGFARPISKERAEASEDKVAKEIETVDRADDAAKASSTNKILSWFLGLGATISAFFKGILDNIESAFESPTYAAIKEFFYDNMLLLAVGLIGIAALIWYKANQAEKSAIKAKDATVEAFREGRLT